MKRHGYRIMLLTVPFVILGILCVSGAGWADITYDANKPYPVARNDLSCWIASAANMLAADGWTVTGGGTGVGNMDAPGYNEAIETGNAQDAQLIFNMLRGQLGITNGGFQNTALSYSINNTGLYTSYDPDETIDVYNSWRMPWNQSAVWINEGLTPRGLIDQLLGTATADGADDPVGIAFHGGKIAHAVTAWSDGAGGLVITDSDDGVTGTKTLTWINSYTLNYYGTAVTVDYMAFLSDGTTPDTFSDETDFVDVPDYPSPTPVPIPGAVLLFGPGLAGLAVMRRKLKK